MTDRNLVGNIVYSVPIAVIVSEPSTEDDLQQLDSFVMTLESLIRQPGIDTSNVYVFYNADFVMVPRIVKLFRYNVYPLKLAADYANDTCKLVRRKVVPPQSGCWENFNGVIVSFLFFLFFCQASLTIR